VTASIVGGALLGFGGHEGDGMVSEESANSDKKATKKLE